MGLNVTKLATTMERLLSNGKKVLIEDNYISGQLRRHISVFGKDGELLSHRVKYRVNGEPMVSDMGARFDKTESLITIDSQKSAINDVLRERKTYTTFDMPRQKEFRIFGNVVRVPKYEYPDVDANGVETAIFDIFRTRFDKKYILDGKALFNADGTISTKTQTLFEPTTKKYHIPALFEQRCEYPPVHGKFIDKIY